MFLTAEPVAAIRVLQSVRERFVGADVTVLMRMGDRRSIPDALLDGFDVRSDKPGPDEGGKRAFVSSLRKTRFDVAVLVWSGARSRTHRAMQAVSVVSGARKKLVYGAHGEPFRLAPRGMKSIAAHGLKRASEVKFSPETALGVMLWSWRVTIGAVAAVFALTWFWWTRGRRALAPLRRSLGD